MTRLHRCSIGLCRSRFTGKTPASLALSQKRPTLPPHLIPSSYQHFKDLYLSFWFVTSLGHLSAASVKENRIAHCRRKWMWLDVSNWFSKLIHFVSSRSHSQIKTSPVIGRMCQRPKFDRFREVADQIKDKGVRSIITVQKGGHCDLPCRWMLGNKVYRVRLGEVSPGIIFIMQ